ncbi:Transcriptional regulatory protein moc3 [Verticillium dahliae VDG1]|nr:Transcriptional regulatory protein moc3 [Verticillium dahliae VDG1]
MDTDHIDELLERYLGLLDQYTNLRAALNEAQSAVYQNLARANFSAERGVRDAPRFSSLLVDEPEAKPKPAPEQEAEPADEHEASTETQAEEKTTRPRPRDPLRWFGILAPMPLRQAQAQAVRAVEDVVPQLVTVDAEMKGLEIQIRRARKKRAKAEIATQRTRAASGVLVEAT